MNDIKKIIEEELSILSDTMICFEETTEEKDKAMERPKVILTSFKNGFHRLLTAGFEAVRVSDKKIDKRYSTDEMRYPYGYNAANAERRRKEKEVLEAIK